MTDKKRYKVARGGWQNLASAANLANATAKRGRKRQLIKVKDGEEIAVLRHGDDICIIDGGGSHIATVQIENGTLKLINDVGQSLTIILAE